MPFTKPQLVIFVSILGGFFIWAANRYVDKADAQADLVALHDKKIAVIETKMDGIERAVNWIADKMGRP